MSPVKQTEPEAKVVRSAARRAAAPGAAPRRVHSATAADRCRHRCRCRRRRVGGAGTGGRTAAAAAWCVVLRADGRGRRSTLRTRAGDHSGAESSTRGHSLADSGRRKSPPKDTDSLLSRSNTWTSSVQATAAQKHHLCSQYLLFMNELHRV